jgi:hypothetical protein
MDPDVPPRTWKRAKWAWKLFKAARAEHRGDFDQGLRLLDEAAQVKALRPEYRVQRAMLLLRAQRLSEAQTAFAALRKECAGSSDSNLQYLTRYCTAMLGMIRGDPGPLAVATKEARSISCQPRLRRKFPLNYRDDGSSRMSAMGGKPTFTVPNSAGPRARDRTPGCALGRGRSRNSLV